MAFLNRVGSIMRQTITQNGSGQVASMLNTIGCMQTSTKLFVGAGVITDIDTGRSRGFGFVNFCDVEISTVQALSATKTLLPLLSISMEMSRQLLRSPTCGTTFRTLCHLSTSTDQPSHHNYHQHNHQFLSANSYLNSWNSEPKDPEEAQARLAYLRREYAKKVKEVRKAYIQEMEENRLEKRRKDEASKEALRLANEERKAAKDAAKKILAAKRKSEQEEFRQTLLKERAEKLEYWKKRRRLIAEKKQEKNELIRRQSSSWIDESQLEKKILEAVVDTNRLV